MFPLNLVKVSTGVELTTQKLSYESDLSNFVLGWRCIYPLQMVIENSEMLYRKGLNNPKSVFLPASNSGEIPKLAVSEKIARS